MVDIVVLSGDVTLYQAIRDSVGERNPVWRARSAAESVDLLMTGRCGVLLVDMAVISKEPSPLVAQIVDQFPDVVVVAAGRRDDEPLLAKLISDGHVYRFMHKPLSPKRAGMFLNAAIRAHVERRGGSAGARALPKAGSLRARLEPRKWLFIGGGLLLFIALLAAALVTRYESARDVRPAADASPVRPATPPVREPQADPVLSRARAAHAAGRFEAPPGRNALDLYAAVRLARPDNAEAVNGLEDTIARVLDRANAAAGIGDRAEARRLAGRVLGVEPNHAAARALLTRLDAQPAPGSPAGPDDSSTAPTAEGPVQGPAAEPSRERAPVQPLRPATAAAAAHPAPPAVAPPATAPIPAPAASQRPKPIPRSSVPPDPLMPRIVNTRPSPTRSPRPRILGRSAVPGHAIAGYVDEARADPQPVPAARTPAAERTGAEAVPYARDLTPVATPEPAYPPQAFRDRIEGWVEVEYTVRESGATDDIRVVAAEPAGVFDASAVGAVADWRYLPRVVNGRPVEQRLSVRLRFSVAD